MASLYIRDMTKPRSGAVSVNKVDAVVAQVGTVPLTADVLAAIDDGDGPWDGYTTDSLVTPEGTYASTRWELVVGPPGTGANLLKVVVSRPINLASLGAAFVAALNDTSIISAASFAGSTLTVAGAADGLGDHSVRMEAFMADHDKKPIPQFVASYVHRGAPGDALQVVFATIVTFPKIVFLAAEA